MYALAIHYAGFLFVDMLFPEWAGSASAGFLMIWYACFALVDIIALMVCRDRPLTVALVASCAWSACLMLEVSMNGDLLQSGDHVAQVLIDIALACCAIRLAYRWLTCKNYYEDKNR